MQLVLTEGVHYGPLGITAADNLSVCQAGDKDEFIFTVSGYRPFIVSPSTDLAGVPVDILEELDNQLYYEGETERRFGKFSETRKHIQAQIDRCN